MKRHRKPKHTHDNYDGDPHSVSVYDDATQYPPLSKAEKDAHAEAKEKYGNQAIIPETPSFAQKKSGHKHKKQAKHHKTKKAHKKDAYDGDDETASPYDDGSNINGGNVY